MPRVKPNINYGLWWLMMCGFTNCKKCTSLVGDADNGGGYSLCDCMEGRGNRGYMGNLCIICLLLL